MSKKRLEEMIRRKDEVLAILQDSYQEEEEEENEETRSGYDSMILHDWMLDG